MTEVHRHVMLVPCSRVPFPCVPVLYVPVPCVVVFSFLGGIRQRSLIDSLFFFIKTPTLLEDDM
jgi:hypothetical protein